MEKTASNGPRNAAEVLVMQKAIDVLSSEGTMSMEKLRTHIESDNLRRELVSKIKAGGLDMEESEIANALQSQLHSAEKVLNHKKGFLSNVWTGTKNVVGGTLKFAGKVLSHPLVAVPVLAVLAFLGYKYLNELSSRAHEFTGKYQKATVEIGNKATTALAPPASHGLTETSGGSLPARPAVSAEDIDPYFGGWLDWFRGGPTPPTGDLPVVRRPVVIPPPPSTLGTRP